MQAGWVARGLVGGLLVLGTTGCGTGIKTTPVAATTPLAADCREPTKVFDTFTVHIDKIAWSGAPARGAATLTLGVKLVNVTEEPASLTNSGNGILYTLQYWLKDAGGQTYTPKEATGVLTGAAVHQLIKPQTPSEGTLTFVVPRGNYTFAFVRALAGQAPPAVPQNTPLICFVPANTPAAGGRPRQRTPGA